MQYRRLQRFSGILLLFAILALVLMSCKGISDRSTQQDETLKPVSEIRSVNGTLMVTLTATLTKLTIGGSNAWVRVYNGSYIPPTLRVKRGDTIKLRLVNKIDQVSNLHYHGMNVSPAGRADNVFVHVYPQSSFEYEIKIPATHPPGLFWYHPHSMGLTEYQTMNGMSGALIVEGILDPFPDLRAIKERVLLLKDIQIVNGTVPTNIDNGQSTMRTVNGQVKPQLTIAPGEMEFWRVGNIGADIYYMLQLDGHLFYEIARDGNRHNQLVITNRILLPPSSRVEFLMLGNVPGIFKFHTLPFSTGPQGDSYPDATLATVWCRGPQLRPPPFPKNFPPVPDLRNRLISTNRTFVFSENAAGTKFYINGKAMNMNRVDTVVPFGTFEEWTLVNVSQEMHVFHIHQLDFQVTEINGVRQPFVGYQDTINMPYTNELSRGPGVVKVLIPFTDPVIIGKFVYHCHIMGHEDNGMMAVIEVTTNSPTALLEDRTRQAMSRDLQWCGNSSAGTNAILVRTE